MAVKSAIEKKKKKEQAMKYYGEPKKKETEEKYVLYHRPWTWFATGAPFEAHGFEFEEGIVYPADDLVYEWSKRRKGFFQIKGVSKKKAKFKVKK